MHFRNVVGSGRNSPLPVDGNDNINFYYGTISEVAAAIRKNGKNEEVVVFEVPASKFNQLNNKYFIGTDAEWERVVDGRNGVQPQYDTVSGLIFLFFF